MKLGYIQKSRLSFDRRLLQCYLKIKYDFLPLIIDKLKLVHYINNIINKFDNL